MFKLYRILQWLRFFSVFQLRFSVYFIKFDDQKWDAFKVFPDFGFLVVIYELNPLSSRDAAIFEIFLKFLENFFFLNILNF